MCPGGTGATPGGVPVGGVAGGDADHARGMALKHAKQIVRSLGVMHKNMHAFTAASLMGRQ